MLPWQQITHLIFNQSRVKEPPHMGSIRQGVAQKIRETCGLRRVSQQSLIPILLLPATMCSRLSYGTETYTLSPAPLNHHITGRKQVLLGHTIRMRARWAGLWLNLSSSHLKWTPHPLPGLSCSLWGSLQLCMYPDVTDYYVRGPRKATPGPAWGRPALSAVILFHIFCFFPTSL